MICRKYRIIFGKLTFRQFSLLFFIEKKQLFLQGVSFKCILHKNNCLCRRSSAAQFAFYNDYNIHVRYQIQDKKYWGDC